MQENASTMTYNDFDPTARRRREMLDETSAFLNWAMSQPEQCLPRIPRRRVDLGGFSTVMERPGARAAANHYWRVSTSMLDSVTPVWCR